MGLICQEAQTILVEAEEVERGHGMLDSDKWEM